MGTYGDDWDHNRDDEGGVAAAGVRGRSWGVGVDDIAALNLESGDGEGVEVVSDVGLEGGSLVGVTGADAAVKGDRPVLDACHNDAADGDGEGVCQSCDDGEVVVVEEVEGGTVIGILEDHAEGDDGCVGDTGDAEEGESGDASETVTDCVDAGGAGRSASLTVEGLQAGGGGR